MRIIKILIWSAILTAIVVVSIMLANKITPKVGDVYIVTHRTYEEIIYSSETPTYDFENPFDSTVVVTDTYTIIEIKNDYCKYKHHTKMVVNLDMIDTNEIGSMKCNELTNTLVKLPKTHTAVFSKSIITYIH